MIEPQDNAVSAWIGIKQILRRRIGVREFDEWLAGGRLLRVLGGDTLLVAFPPRGRVLFKAQGRLGLMRRLAGQRGFSLVLTVYPDDYQRQRIREQSGYELEFIDPLPLPDGHECPGKEVPDGTTCPV